MTNLSNPAERLHVILSDAQDIQNGQKSTMNMWADLFEIDLGEPDGMPKLTNQLSRLHELVYDVKTKIEGMDVNHGLYLRHFHRIEQAVRIDQLGAPWASLSKSLTEAAMDNLEHCSELLSADFSEDQIQDQIVEIKDKVDQLAEEVLASSLEKDVEEFILNELETIRRGIFEYRLRGASGLRQAVATTIGNIIINQEVSSSNNDKGCFSKLKGLIFELDKLSSAALHLKALAAPAVSKALGFFS